MSTREWHFFAGLLEWGNEGGRTDWLYTGALGCRWAYYLHIFHYMLRSTLLLSGKEAAWPSIVSAATTSGTALELNTGCAQLLLTDC